MHKPTFEREIHKECWKQKKMTQKNLLTSFESSKLILDWSDGADFDICNTLH